MAAPLTLNHGDAGNGAAARRLLLFSGCVMPVQRGHWLEYDPIALAALVIGIGIVMLVALNI